MIMAGALSVTPFRPYLLVLGIGQEITIDYRNTLADWLSIIQSKTIFTLQKTVISIKQTCYMCTW